MWHEPADPARPLTGRYRVISGQHMLNASSSHLTPKPAFAVDRKTYACREFLQFDPMYDLAMHRKRASSTWRPGPWHVLDST